jgi:hypothetical protein
LEFAECRLGLGPELTIDGAGIEAGVFQVLLGLPNLLLVYILLAVLFSRLLHPHARATTRPRGGWHLLSPRQQRHG